MLSRGLDLDTIIEIEIFDVESHVGVPAHHSCSVCTSKAILLGSQPSNNAFQLCL